MKTHKLTSSLVIPSVGLSIGWFSSFTPKDVTPFSEVKLPEGVERNLLWQVQMREEESVFGSVSETGSREYGRRPSRADAPAM